MIINNLQLKHFRNYDNLDIYFNEKVNIFIGNNGQGKTNIIESIYMLAITKSHRTFTDNNVIKNGFKVSKIRGIIKKNIEDSNSEVELLLNNKGKKLTINKKQIKKISDYISYLNVVIFHPDDLEILKGSPHERRKFLNIEIGQLDNIYIFILNNYNNVLKQRNEYLKSINIDNYDKDYLEILTNQLIDNAIKIYKYRSNFIDNINKKLDFVNKRIKGLESIEIKYESYIPLDNFEELREILKNKYDLNLKREIIMAQTMIGPHRDDFVFLVNGKNAKSFSSQGQQRIAVLMLKLGEIEMFYERYKEYPILLLDDIFSELDIEKKENIVKYINRKMQIIITTTDINDVDKSLIRKASVFMVDNALVYKTDNFKSEV